MAGLNTTFSLMRCECSNIEAETGPLQECELMCSLSNQILAAGSSLQHIPYKL